MAKSTASGQKPTNGAMLQQTAWTSKLGVRVRRNPIRSSSRPRQAPRRRRRRSTPR